MHRKAILTLAILVSAFAAACSGDAPGQAERFGLRASSPAASIKPVTPRSSAVPLPATLPPASMFVGPSSWRTGPARYCRGEGCATLTPPKPAPLAGPAGSAVFFALSAAPSAVVLQITVPGSAEPTRVELNPGTAIVWQATLPLGTYPLMLTATYPQAVVTWPFALKIAPAAKEKR